MARKFNIGRQSEHLLNKELHDLFMTLKYINHSSSTPIKDEQTEIPDKSLWLDRYFGADVLKAYDKVTESWSPIFKGFYHPSNALERPENPAHGQLWVDYTKDNLLNYYDKNTNTWVPISAITNMNMDGTGTCHNFDLMYLDRPILTDGDKKVYAVHNEQMGKLFDGKKYIHPSDDSYIPNSIVAIEYIDKYKDENENWIHVNSVNVNKIVKRLIKINYDSNNDAQAGLINITDHNTEFYGMNLETGLGTLLVRAKDDFNTEDYDYERFQDGIRLLHDKYEYVYAISYDFSNYVGIPGRLIRNSGIVGTEDNIHIGPTNKRVFVFLDGLYLEQDKYTYNEATDSIQLTNDNITNTMDFIAMTVPDYSKGESGNDPLEYKITSTGIASLSKELKAKNISINLGDNDAIVGPLYNAANFITPMAFVCGVHGDTNTEPKEVEIIDSYAIIRNIGPIEEDDFYKVMIIEAEGMYPTYGEIGDSLRIESDIIDTENTLDNYFVFIDGVLASPRDLDIAKGSIGALGFKKGQKYLLLKSNSNENVEAELMMDSLVSHFTIKVEDNNSNTIYDDADSAIVYVDNGVLIDRNAISTTSLPVEGKKGEIVLLDDPLSDPFTTVSLYQWEEDLNSWRKIDPMTDDFTAPNPEFTNAYDLIYGYFSTRGSISILNKKHVGKPYTYYVYTYVNSIDERLLWGDRITSTDKLEYAVNHRHKFPKGKNSVSAYLGGLYILGEELENDSIQFEEFKNLNTIGVLDKKDYTDELNKLNIKLNPLDNSDLTYIVELPEENEDLAMERECLTAVNKLEGNVPNTYETKNMLLSPGVVTVYVNGVRLPKDEFVVVSPKVITILRDTVGGQSISEKDDVSTHNKFMVMNDDGPIIIDCESTDIITVEVRRDFKIKEVTLPVRFTRQNTWSVKVDGIPESLINSNDEIKIYINGIFYGCANKDNINKELVEIDINRGELILKHPDVISLLHTDPIETYFATNHEEHIKYIEANGKPYYPAIQENYITLEWR